LPIALPVVATVSMFAFLNSWNEFLASLIFLSDQNKFTLPIMLVNVSSGIYVIIDWGALQAGIAVTMVPCILLLLHGAGRQAAHVISLQEKEKQDA
ncbi:hypothetical protein ACC705_34330, partial [Rhizobium ruizarguesonis]